MMLQQCQMVNFSFSLTIRNKGDLGVIFIEVETFSIARPDSLPVNPFLVHGAGEKGGRQVELAI